MVTIAFAAAVLLPIILPSIIALVALMWLCIAPELVVVEQEESRAKPVASTENILHGTGCTLVALVEDFGTETDPFPPPPAKRPVPVAQAPWAWHSMMQLAARLPLSCSRALATHEPTTPHIECDWMLSGTTLTHILRGVGPPSPLRGRAGKESNRDQKNDSSN